jgi:uncharacterized membrane protein SpoIIM required for sporulation
VVFVFAPVAVVVDDLSALSSITRAVEFIRREKTDAVFYVIFAITVIFLYSGIFGAVSTIGVGSLAALGGLLVVSPVLDLYKVTVYAGSKHELPLRSMPAVSPRTQVKNGLVRGWVELLTFVRTSPAYLLFATIFLGIGVYSGVLFADPLSPFISVSIESRIEGLFPLTAGFEFFANNWSVASTMAYSGILLGAPTIILLWINGASIGLLFQLETNKLALIGFVVPHGVFEIPAIIIAGATGMFLGMQSWHAYRNDDGAQQLASTLQRVFWILVGLGIILGVAGIIEGFISPVVSELATTW